MACAPLPQNVSGVRSAVRGRGGGVLYRREAKAIYASGVVSGEESRDRAAVSGSGCHCLKSQAQLTHLFSLGLCLCFRGSGVAD